MTNLSKKSISPFLETIKLEGGFFSALSFHQARMDATRAIFFDNPEPLSLPLALMKAGSIPPKGLYRTRVIYSDKIELIEFIPYEKREVTSLKLIEANIDYSFKYEKRPELNTLFQQKKKCDDILITKKGYLTDTSIANIALLKNGTWYTPKSPLLKGTKRAALLHHGLVIEDDIHQDNLQGYESIRLFNAMIEFGEIEFSIKNIQAP
ncbi:aminotransferase class IV [Ignatzschineria rhizosphaerae]|uniref:Aminotransferase class IV n=1 Tax=Ignatzschineria rhizosphaerae TaxID=2923279 RepID=A0ABY3WX53_9GAMM|nr:aminotransferase class IV [Ignatzschineria rhizosphaerae]UNM95187.1 aminotransferase class IV [Ignatzschineria rhizosphaerae]